MTLQAGANLIGSTRTAWCDWEHGRRVPNRFFMPKVCEAMGLEPNDFYAFASDTEIARKAA